jgi:serine/threonine protein kinase
MEGGRFLGAGTYGCAFSPPLLCASGMRKSMIGKVGKITDNRFAELEIQVANRIRRVPLARNYFLLPEPESCDLKEESQQVDPGLELCEAEFEEDEKDLNLTQMKQIVMPFGGTLPFYEMFRRQTFQPKTFDYSRFLRHMLEAGSTLLLAGVVHFDIHPGNMLVDKQKVIRILDFGLSFPTNNISATTLDGRWKRLRFGFEENAGHPANHNSEPPEITIMNAIRRNEFTIEQAIGLTIEGKQIFQDMQKYLGLSKESCFEDMVRFWKTSDLAQKRDFVKMWKIYWPGFDAWAIGCICMDTLTKLILFPEFLKGSFAEKRVSILSTLRGLLDPNPRDRLDCIEALALFDPGNPWLNRFGQKWLQVRKQQRKGKI